MAGKGVSASQPVETYSTEDLRMAARDAKFDLALDVAITDVSRCQESMSVVMALLDLREYLGYDVEKYRKQAQQAPQQ